MAARAACLILAGLSLSACESNPEPASPFGEHRVPLEDGTSVTCLTYDRALDCDWSKR